MEEESHMQKTLFHTHFIAAPICIYCSGLTFKIPFLYNEELAINQFLDTCSSSCTQKQSENISMAP